MKINEFIHQNFPVLTKYLSIYKNHSILKIWDWPYSEYVIFLKAVNEFMRENPKEELYLFCSHQACLTNGFGLEKDRNGTKKNLVPFKENSDLTLPLFQIKRGGGLTFHYPGQLNFYPIFNLASQKRNLQTYMMRLLKTSSTILNEQLDTENFHYKGEFLGLWYDKIKVGSIGMGLDRFITQHGFSFNFYHDVEFYSSLSSLFPCGLQVSSYTSIDQIFEISLNKREEFIESFLLKMF